MPSMNTPTRAGRGLFVHNIDTKHDDRPPPCLLGLHTPPQSANESRRPSLQFLAQNENTPYSATSSTLIYSTPVTPVHAVSHGSEVFVHSWSGNVPSQSDMIADMKVQCAPIQVTGPSLDAAFNPQPACASQMTPFHGLPNFGFTAPTTNPSGLGLRVSSGLQHVPSWTSSNQLSHGLAAHTSCLGPSLFPAPPQMTSSVNGMDATYEAVGSSFHGINTSFDGSLSTDLFQTPRVVVPSQLSPDDVYHQQSVDDIPHHDSSMDGLSTSFDSGSTSFAAYGSMDSPSPMEPYFERSDDEHFVVKNEELSDLDTPERSRGGPSRSRRRSSKRLRDGDKRPWHSHDIPNGDPYAAIEVQCVGKRFPLDRPMKREIANSKKPHQCLFTDKDGSLCGARFDRSEHLKRHAGKHSNVRLFPCPLPGCKKGDKPIGRPDNAGDHFKSHLRPKRRGTRNDHFEWEFLSRAIWDAYPDKKKATKLIENLRRWVEAGMPETSSKRTSKM